MHGIWFTLRGPCLVIFSLFRLLIGIVRCSLEFSVYDILQFLRQTYFERSLLFALTVYIKKITLSSCHLQVHILVNFTTNNCQKTTLDHTC